LPKAYFFLTIYDIVQFAKKQNILYQGRGSAANSVVCYCLEITAVDPRQISVLFERFISKERNEPPDIDVDFEHERREEVIQYIYRKYGRERTALIGFPRHLSQHVGGFVISSGPLYELVPIENAAMADRTVIQWDKDDLESLKLLKVDVLALGMLTAIRKCFDLLDKHYKQDCSIPFITKLGDDKQVFRQIQKADTVGIFQIESRAQMSMLPRLKPKCYYDLVVQIAIVRPGPIQGDMVHPYLRRRDGLEPVTYPSKEIEKVLSRTMGVPIFQEQVIQLAMVAAGFSGGEADQLRRTERHYSIEYAERLFEQICGFGEYGFPESHSASFAVLAYVSSWLKHYYPAVFYTGLLNALPMGFYTPSQIVQDAKHHKIKILPCCALHSSYDHNLVYVNKSYAIRLGLRLIKGLKQSSIERLVERRSLQSIHTLYDVKALCLPNTCMQALASANAFACFTDNRFNARWEIIEQNQTLPLFASVTQANQNTKVPSYISKVSSFENLIEDYASIGLSIKQHPISMLDEANLLPSFTTANALYQIKHKSLVKVIGVVTCKQSPETAAGVTFITLEDHTGNTNVIIWQNSARAQKQTYLNAKILQVNGILERGDGNVIHVIAGRLIDQTHLLNQLRLTCREFR